MKLNDLIKTINTNKLKALIEAEPVYESKMLKTAFNDIVILNMPAIELYRLHFALFHLLYKLQDEYVRMGKYLYIHFMRTSVFDYPEIGECTFFDEADTSFCKHETADGERHCRLHMDKLGTGSLESLSQKYFYLDETNFDKLDSVTAESLLSGAWEILNSDFSINNAYLNLGLHGHENIQTIKKMRFRDLSKKHHPDNGGDKDKFMTINRSYRMLIKWLEEAHNLS